MRVFLGLDGFVDEICQVVDKRESAQVFQRVTTIADFAQRLAAAAGKSTNIELVTQTTKLGGNGPIMANALATLGLEVHYLGALGYPALHPVFRSFAETSRVFSIADPGFTSALEFEDGKVMLGRTVQLNDITWPNIVTRYGREKFIEQFAHADLAGFVNWTMIPYMTEVWERLLEEVCPLLTGPRRLLFFDLADPEKRSREDIARALELIARFERFFEVILGLNEKEAGEVAGVLGLSLDSAGLAGLAAGIRERVPVSAVVIHPVSYACAAGAGTVCQVEGPVIRKPLITTGAGDHFNAGFCLGKLLGFDNACSLLTAVGASGYYVRKAASPTISGIVQLLRRWPEK